MARRRRTQKQISERYQGNLDYFKRFRPGRAARFVVSFLALSLGLAAIIAYQRRGDERFFNPGPLSKSHAALAENCASCHDKSSLTRARLTPEQFKQTLQTRFAQGIAFEPIDKNCAACHLQRDKRVYDFHEPNVLENRSCSVCHQEHRGTQSLQTVSSTQCASCHNNALTMAAAAAKGRQLEWKNFQRHPYPPQQIVFDLPRPVDGFTHVFPSFWNGHPEFQLKREEVRDPDLLKFNHQRHFAPDIPMVGGRKLECAYCHQPDSEGRFYNQRAITFADNCQACHSLQFDPMNPELALPHGDPAAVRGFLLSLPAQYAELAAKKGLTQPNEIKNFVTRQMLQLRARVHSGEDFERQIFYSKNPYKPEPGMAPRERALYYGCAVCHDPQPVKNAAPLIAKPVLIDRWMLRSDFDHASHRMVKCDDCHQATRSRLTSDVLMPGIASCVTCHSPKGKVAAECSTCHDYHAPVTLTAVTLPGAKRQAGAR